MKTLKQIQEENRKFIIMANNQTAKTYEEALEMELDFGCIIYDILDNISDTQAECNYHKIIYSSNGIMFTVKSLDGYNRFNDVCLENLLCKDYFKIIGKPLTLSRVLIAFGRESLDLWEDLTKETLEEQNEKVQRKFNELIK